MAEPPPQIAAALPPGAVIGVLGSGQLGRMLAMAAARLGLRTHVYADGPGPAFDVAAEKTVAAYDDWSTLEKFAHNVAVVTYEFENVPVVTAERLNRLRPVRPGPRALEVAQDRLVEKEFIAGLGIAVAPFNPVTTAEEAADALARMAAPAILKTRRLGYDGKGQAGLAPGDDARAAWSAIGGVPAVLERRLVFVREVSVLVVRGLAGETRFYDIPENRHEGGILARSSVPSGLEPAVARRAEQMAARIAAALDYVGVLAVEMFDLGPGFDAAHRLIVNEIAPRVHNSGHWTIDACAVSQFENHIRAVAGWPLGDTSRHSDADMENLIGPMAHDWPRLAGEAGVSLHLYGKRDARPGRKMGHVTRLTARSPLP